MTNVLHSDLRELTGKESGIVIYDSRDGILCNWSSINGLPRLFFGGCTGMGEDIPDVDGVEIDDIADYLDGVNLSICAYLGDDDELSGAGTLYEISDSIIVITPVDWA